MSIEHEAMQAIHDLESTIQSERAKAVLAFVKKNGFTDRKILTFNGECHSAPDYAVQLISHTQKIMRNAYTPNSESVQIVSLLLAHEECSLTSCMSPGAELVYDIHNAGIMLSKYEVTAFMAPLGHESHYAEQRRRMLLGHPLIIAVYCARLLARYGTMTGTYSIFVGPETSEEVQKKLQGCACPSIAATVEALVKTFVVEYVGKENQGRLDNLLTWMANSGFYAAPFDPNGLLDFEQGLSLHCVNFIYRHIGIERPQTVAQAGKIILSDILACLYSALRYTWDGTRQCYNETAVLPIGQGRAALQVANEIACGLFPKETAVAIDCCYDDVESSKTMAILFSEYPLALTMYVANLMAVYKDDKATHKKACAKATAGSDTKR